MPEFQTQGERQCWASTMGPGQMTANTCCARPAQVLCSPHTVQINRGRHRYYPHGTNEGTEAQGSRRTGRAGS